jgi:glycosyl transferase family 87
MDRPSSLPGRLANVALRAVVMLVCLLLIGWHAFVLHHLTTRLELNDLGKLYASAVKFSRGEDMYAPVQQAWARDARLPLLRNLNPPHAHLPLLPLTGYPPGVTLAAWAVASGAALVFVGWLLWDELRQIGAWRRRGLLLMALAFAGTTAITVTGQLSFLFLVPVTLAWLAARRGRWRTAGAYVGLALSLKLFFAIFLPYFALRRRLDAILAACLSAACCFAAGLVVFGVQAHREWLRTLTLVNWSWVPMNGSLHGMLSRTLAPTAYFEPIVAWPAAVAPAWLVVAGIIGLTTLVAACWGDDVRSIDRAFAVLLVGALLLSPLGWIYYLWLAAGPLLALYASWVREGLERWRRVLLIVAVVCLLWPLVGLEVFQPSRLATLTVASVYFWGTLALWAALVVDVFARRHGRSPHMVMAETNVLVYDRR